MGIHAFLAPDARRQTTEAIRRLESTTSAEVVVVVRLQSSHHRAADLTAGALVSFASLLVLLFSPAPVALEVLPLDVAASFAIGALLATRSPWVERVLTPARERRRQVHAGACAAFVDHKIGRTRGRTGILVYVSLLERAVEVVADVGVDPATLGPPWTEALAALERALSPRPDLARFLETLSALGPVLGRVLPRSADDRNELNDEVLTS